MKQREARNRILESVLLGRTDQEEASMEEKNKSSFTLLDGRASAKKDDRGEYILKLIMGKAESKKEEDRDGG
jgi:hypothetical protein